MNTLRKILPIFFSITLLLFLIRLALPQYVKYLLFPSVALLGILVLVELLLSARWKQLNFKHYAELLPFFILVLLFLFAFAVTPSHSPTLRKDTINLMVLCAFVIAALLFRYSSSELVASLKKFKLLTVVISPLIALAGIVKLYFLLKGHVWQFLMVDGLGYPQGTSLSVDDNFFTLVCVVGIIFATQYLFTYRKQWQSIMLQLALFLLLLNIMLATSRRGLIIAFAYLVVYLLAWLASWFVSRESVRYFRRNSSVFLTTTGITISLLTYLILGVSPFDRNKWLANSNLDRNQATIYFNWLTMAGESIFRGDVTYDDVQKEIWETQFDSRYPFSGWAAGNYRLVDNLQELGLSGLPADAKGAMVGNWVESSTWDEKAFYYSKLFEGKVEPGKRYLASVYCYVSPDFDGSWVRLSNNGNLKGINQWYFNLNRKGSWQKLQTSFYADSGNFKTYLYVCKENATNLNNLKGNVIFAFPQVKEIEFDPKEPVTWANRQFEPVTPLPGDGSDNLPEGTIAYMPLSTDIRFREKDSLWIYGTGLFRYGFQDSMRIIPSLYVYVSPDFNGDEVYINTGGNVYGLSRYSYDLTQKGTWQKLYLSFNLFEGNGWVDYGFKRKAKSPTDSIKGYVFFAYPEERFLRFDPNNPITWTGSNFKQVFPLRGKNVEIVPKNCVGLKVDNTVQPKVYKDIVYNTNSIVKIKFKNEKQRVKTSVYAYVSDDFNGEKVRLGGGSSKKFAGYSAAEYDINRKGTWQKLTINNWGEAGVDYYSTTYFELPNAKDFKSLTGYVILAHPEFRILNFDPKNPESYTSSTHTREYPLEGKNAEIVPQGVAGAKYTNKTEGKQWRDLHHSTTLYWGVQAEPGDSVFASVYCYVSPDFNGQEARLEIRGKVTGSTNGKYDLKAKGEWVLLQAKGMVTEKGMVYGAYFFSQKGVTDFSSLTGHITFAYPQLIVKPKLTSLLHSDSKLNRAGILLADDLVTVNDSITSGFELTMQSNRFAGPRIDRWRYALYLYVNEYTVIQKLFGGGFTYTVKFARKFHPDDPSRDFDYPHNPFLSVLLYSGLLGLIVYFWFFARTLYIYYTYRKDYWIFGVVFLVVFFYSFFSSNSPFEPAFFGIISFLPYLIHYTKKYWEHLY